jgi:phosphomethylpyrimidine synthase
MFEVQDEVLKQIGADERVALELLRDRVMKGTIVVPYNSRRPCRIKGVGIGAGLRTKVNANLGGSPDRADLATELTKLKVAIEAGADTVMDLSVCENLDEIRAAVIEHSTVPVGTVPVYEGPFEAKRHRKSFVELTVSEILQCIERHLKEGVDFITVHCGLTRAGVERLRSRPRLTGVVSRGGSLLMGWMDYQNKENPLYSEYDELLGMARDYGVTLSLGDGLRPGSLYDATDPGQIQELLVIGELVERARSAGVQAMVEGPGHIPLDQIQANVILEKAVCKGAPFYLLGPLVTDVACGYDHITSAIGGALAAWAGADFLCYVTPAEHLGLPGPEDVRAGVIASRIAAHAGDLAKGVKGARDWDDLVSQARGRLDWARMIQLALDPERAKELYQASRTPGVCTMCGEFCAIRESRRVLPCIR